MTSWTLIPFYLWKNTCRRWLEYPVSPFSKILIPSLLGFLALGVLTLFAEIEGKLREQLAESSVYTVSVSEFVGGEDAPTILRKTSDEEVLWAGRYGETRIRQVRQPLISISWEGSRNTPLLAYSSFMTEWREMQDIDAPPSVWLLTDDPAYRGRSVHVGIGNRQALAPVKPVPDWMRTGLSLQTAAVIPVEMIEAQLADGFINYTVADLRNIAEVEDFVKNTTAYYNAERRQVKIISALGILKNLEQINAIQGVVRTLIVMGCGIILALTLGSIAWLEYRQDSYLLALLKSFGTPSVVLLFHMFLENLLLVLSGIILVSTIWLPIYRMAGPQLESIGLKATTMPAIPPGDVAIILLSGLVGVIFAMVPVAFGLRKPAGLILQ